MNLPLLLLVALLTGACGATQALAGASQTSGASHPVAARVGGRPGPQALGESVDNTPLHVLFIGASVTEGWFASTKERSYTALVAKGLGGDRRVHVQVMARPGVTASEADGWDLNVSADITIVQIATNDFARNVPVDEYSAAYAVLLDRLRVASPKGDLICMGAWSDPTQRNRLGAEVVEYDLAARTQCEAAGGHYVDLSAAYLNASNHGPAGRDTYLGRGDTFHPNDAGHAELAELVLAADGVPVSKGPAT